MIMFTIYIMLLEALVAVVSFAAIGIGLIVCLVDILFGGHKK